VTVGITKVRCSAAEPKSSDSARRGDFVQGGFVDTKALYPVRWSSPSEVDYAKGDLLSDWVRTVGT